ncbi:hypothetical protein [Ramlibacter sp. AN1133]|uniref:hypothetical protein n=1 Tax=Ramlibacter sp. AN1133 TaxID=3133429 RepID=UPI0030BBECA5
MRGRRPVAFLRAIAAGVALLACSQEAAALSSGAPRGTPLIGRAFQISIPVAWERGESPPCVRAEFLQGDSPGGPLRWRLDQASESTGLLRLASSLPVQEPVVTVQLALGCAQQYVREYVLLAEPANEARDAQAAAEAGGDLPVALAPLALAPATTLASAPPSANGERPAAAAASTNAPVARAPAPAVPRHRAQRSHPAAARAAAAPQRRESAPKVAAARQGAAAARPAGPRLKLEPIDIAIDDAPVLRLTSTLAPSVPSPGGTAASADARGLWQALNTSPEQQAAQAQATLALQAELKSMRELVQRYGAESRAATQRLEKVSGERDLMLDVLLGLVAVLGGGLGFLLWQRSRETAVLRSWWQEEHGGPSAAKAAKPAAPQAAPLVAAGAAVAAPAPTAAPSEQPAAGESGPDDALVDLPDFLEFDQGRALTAEELLGLKEKADFFLAVGQPEKAVQLLESQLQEHTSSPFVWLDLLDLCRRLERRDDYERLRIAFQKLFSARMPAFDAAMPESNGLEDHPRALSRITQLWGTARVLKVIEDSLFEEAKPGSITFDLEASRDLLLLYGIASDALAASATRENFGGAFPSTMRTPLVSAAPSETEPVPLVALDQLDWPASLLPPAEPAGDPPEMPPVPAAPAAPAPPEAADAPDIDLADLAPDSLLPDDLDFSLSLPPAPPERAR